MPPPDLLNLIPVSDELAGEAYRDLVIEFRAERFAIRALVWVVVVWVATYPLDRIMNTVRLLITTIRARRV